MKSFQAICLQFCVTLSASFLTCHKNAAQTHTHIHSYSSTGGHTTRQAQDQLQIRTHFQSRTKLATRQGVTLINGAALLTPTSLSVRLPVRPFDSWFFHGLCHFTFIFYKTFFVCQFQERFPLSVIKCSVAVINLFRSIVDDDARPQNWNALALNNEF